MTVYTQVPPVEPGVSQKLAQWRAVNYSDVRYKLNITLEKGASLMKGEIEIRVNISEEGAKSDLILDWRTTQFENDKDKPFADVAQVNDSLIKKLPDSGDFAYAIDKEHIFIAKRLLKAGENYIKIKFASPVKTSGAAITRYVDKEDGAEYVYSLFVPSDASTAFPVFDQPDLKAKFTLTLVMPEKWKAISNTNPAGNPRITQFGGRNIRTLNLVNFEETKPISTYVFAFAAGDFAEFADETARKESLDYDPVIEPNSKEPPKQFLVPKIYVRKSQAEKFKQHSAEVFRLNREGVKYLESYFDFKFPFPKYDLVLIPEFPFGGMEHAGATFLRESSVIFPSEPTANDKISRANVIFHEAAHQWFGDTVTMKWFDDLWLKEGFAEFMAYKTLESCMPEYDAWKTFYERNKPLAYATDSTRGTTPIYQEIPNLSAAKSAYGNIVYRKAPSFLRQAEFYLGEDKFQTAVRAFLKKYQYKNAEWTDLVDEFETASKYNLKSWSQTWVKKRGLPKVGWKRLFNVESGFLIEAKQEDSLGENSRWEMLVKFLVINKDGTRETFHVLIPDFDSINVKHETKIIKTSPQFILPNYQDYGYGIFLIDEKSRDYVLKNIQNEKNAFLRSMMWGALWDSVREGELNPKDYVELAIKNINVETDELTIQTILSRVSTAMNYYLSDAQKAELAPPLENLLIDKMQNAPILGQRITFYRAFLNIASTDKARNTLKQILSGEFVIKRFNCSDENCGRRPQQNITGNAQVKENQDSPVMSNNQGASLYLLKTKDKFDIVTKLAILGDADAPRLLADLQKTETGDDAKRYAYAVGAAFPGKEAKEKYFNDFLNNKEISESWIESALVPFNPARHSELTLPYLEKALVELPNLKRNRKIFFVNGWLAAFIGGQKDEKALAIINKFLADNPNLDKDLRLKILENVDVIERSVKIRKQVRNEK
ncbi:MAG: M1 family aminopeptidase [Pyrinomonadaceae bacterium]